MEKPVGIFEWELRFVTSTVPGGKRGVVEKGVQHWINTTLPSAWRADCHSLSSHALSPAKYVGRHSGSNYYFCAWGGEVQYSVTLKREQRFRLNRKTTEKRWHRNAWNSEKVDIIQKLHIHPSNRNLLLQTKHNQLCLHCKYCLIIMSYAGTYFTVNNSE